MFRCLIMEEKLLFTLILIGLQCKFYYTALKLLCNLNNLGKHFIITFKVYFESYFLIERNSFRVLLLKIMGISLGLYQRVNESDVDIE